MLNYSNQQWQQAEEQRRGKKVEEGDRERERERGRDQESERMQDDAKRMCTERETDRDRGRERWRERHYGRGEYRCLCMQIASCSSLPPSL